MPRLKFLCRVAPQFGFVKKGSPLGFACLMAIGCRPPNAQVAPSIEFTRLPPADEGSSEVLYTIEGRVKGARPDQKIVLFARSGVWWVQPQVEQPFTPIQRDSTWRTSTHPGSAYAALLVNPDYKPPSTVNILPQKGGPVQSVAVAAGAVLEQPVLKKLDFSGYDWLVRQVPGNPAGTRNQYEAANAWVDPKGFLHLRIRKTSSGWTSAEVALSRSFGYGSYRFVVSDISHLESPVVLAISTWDASGPYREMDVEISRFGEPSGKNTQYVVQPYYVPANVVRFFSPAGRLTYSFDWAPGRVAFRTVRGLGTAIKADLVAAHVFTSGVPSPGSETVHMNLYTFDNGRVRLQNGAEVIIEKFEYLP
jgi:hypothetical protein